MSYLGNAPDQQTFTPQVDYFSGNNSTTSFTLSRNVASVAQVEAVIENVVQNPSDAYTVLNNVITFTSAPPAGSNNIYVRYTSPITKVMVPTASSVNTNELANQGVTPAKMVNLGYEYGMRNRIINGAMMIDQRNAGASVTVNAAGLTYSVDRFGGFGQSSDGVYTLQQSTTAPAGFVNSLLAITTTADSSLTTTQEYGINQRIEGLNTADLAWGTASAAPITVSFWVRSSLTGTFGGSLRNNGSARSYPFSYTISAANTWEQKTVTIAGDTSGTWLTTNGIGIIVQWSLGAGPDRLDTAGFWVSANRTGVTGQVNVIGTNGATFYITGVQLEKGTVATPFEYRPIGTELALCQRYYTSTQSGSGIRVTIYADSVISDGQVYCPFKVSMRADPTVAVVGSGTTLANSGALSTYLINKDGFSFNVSSTSGSGMRGYTSCTFTATAEL